MAHVKYVVLTPLGEIVKTGEVLEAFIEGVAEAPNTYLLDENVPTVPSYWDFASQVWITKPGKPTKFHVWNVVTKTWEDPRSLDELKAIKWEAIKAARAVAENEPFIWDGSSFGPDMTRINGAVTTALIAQSMSQPYTVDWTLTDNTVRTLNASQMILVGLNLSQHISGIYDKARALRALIDAATTAAEVEAITWNTPV